MQLPKLPRAAYWIIGAAIAFTGAIAARVIAEYFPGNRVLVWLIGAGVIFFGLGILSLGTRSHLEGDARSENADDQN